MLKFALYISTIILVLCTKAIAIKYTVNSPKAIKLSIDFAIPFDTIIIEKGIYKMNDIQINKPMTIIGHNFPIFDGRMGSEIFIVKSNHVTIQGLSLQNVGVTSLIDWAAIKILESENVKIIGNRIYNCYFGIYLSASNKCIVKKNVIVGNPKEEQNTGNGIHAWKCDSLIIENNQVSKHRDGIYFEFVTNTKISYNDSQQNIRYGLHFMFSHNNGYFNNIFHKNGAGVAVMYTKHVTMKNNIFEKNWGGAAYGLLLKDISDSEISNNQFITNTVGLYMEGVSRSLFSKNNFTQNGYAIKVQADCDENTLNYCNFRGNTFDIASNGNIVMANVANNYWDKYEGYDLNKNGIGDVPFRPVSLFATVIERIPQAALLLRSFTVTLLDRIEKIIPSLTPENMVDTTPSMKPILFIR